MGNLVREKSLRECIVVWLENNVSAKRLQHILGVEQTCIDLARCHHLDETQAAWAGLMHDLAKFFPQKKLLKMAQQEGIKIDAICQSYPHLLHAEVSAIVARKEFGIKDPEILEAIRNHTLGSPQMSLLSCLVYVADAIEPNRGKNPELKRLRKIANTNLYQCVHKTSDYAIHNLITSHQIIHPRTILTRNWALTKTKQLLRSVD